MCFLGSRIDRDVINNSYLTKLVSIKKYYKVTHEDTKLHEENLIAVARNCVSKAK